MHCTQQSCIIVETFCFYNIFVFFLMFYLFIFGDRRRGETEREKHQCMFASRAPPTGGPTWLATQACALTGNQISNHLVCRPVLNPPHHIYSIIQKEMRSI